MLKRGFNRTEEVFRQESKHLGPDGKPIYQLANLGPKKYQRAFNLLREWVENNLDIYKVTSFSTFHFLVTDSSSLNCQNFSGQSLSIPSWSLSAIPTLRMPRLSSEKLALIFNLFTQMTSRHLQPLHYLSMSTRTP